MDIRPQPGPQEQFLSTPADIAIYGGGAGGGKTYALLLEPLRWVKNNHFTPIIFRKTCPQIKTPGGLWDESRVIYPLLQAVPREYSLTWKFPSGCELKFSHLEHEKDVYAHQGGQYCLLELDELTHFSEYQFFYLLSRNRSTCGVRPYVRAACNPDPDSWVRSFLDWWIDAETGLAIAERSGVLRWFVRSGDDFLWGGSKNEMLDKYGEDSYPKSVTFVPASVFDNKILLAKNPEYLANLKALPLVERERLLGCNWNVRVTAGLVFRDIWFTKIDRLPSNIERTVRFWDRAATKPRPGRTNPDWSVGVKMSILRNKTYIVEDVVRFRERPAETETIIENTARADGILVPIRMEQEPGSSGVDTIDHYHRNILPRFNFKGIPSSGSKIERANPLSAQAEAGNVSLMRASWNKEFLAELMNFPPPASGHDDQVDAASGAYNCLAKGKKSVWILKR